MGGVGAGKSTVAAEFARYGCRIISADRIAHELLETDDIRNKVISKFGQSIADNNYRVDRKKLGEIVFNDKESLKALTDLLHPPVLKRIEELIGLYKSQKSVAAIVLDVPLLLEIGWQDRCDRLIFVDCQRRRRLERAKKKGIKNENQLELRENFQISLDNKARLADNIIDNNSDFSSLAEQVSEVFSLIMNKS